MSSEQSPFMDYTGGGICDTLKKYKSSLLIGIIIIVIITLIIVHHHSCTVMKSRNSTYYRNRQLNPNVRNMEWINSGIY